MAKHVLKSFVWASGELCEIWIYDDVKNEVKKHLLLVRGGSDQSG